MSFSNELFFDSEIYVLNICLYYLLADYICSRMIWLSYPALIKLYQQAIICDCRFLFR